jgi:hypothetical protein
MSFPSSMDISINSCENEKVSNVTPKDLSFLTLHYDVYYQCRSPWKWVFEEAFAELFLNIPRETISNTSACDKTSTPPAMKDQRCFPVSYAKGLPSYATKNASRMKNEWKQFSGGGCTLRMEWIGRGRGCKDVDELYCSHYYFHGTSSAMDGLADKDEFVRTMKRYRCEYLSPPTILIDWDASESFCRSVRFPTLGEIESTTTTTTTTTTMLNEFTTTDHNNDNHFVAVLKTPLGSRGEGVYFISHTEELLRYVRQNYIRAVEEGQGKFLQQIYDCKGRIPSWVLQAEIYPPMLLLHEQKKKKFHIRSYIVVKERKRNNDLMDNNNNTDTLDVYIYNRHEVRVASAPFHHDNTAKIEKNNFISAPADNHASFSYCGPQRNRHAHITNGASSDETKRYLLHHVAELAPISHRLELFLAQAFGRDLLPNMLTLMSFNNRDISKECTESSTVAKFAFSGVDIMLDDSGRFYILEVNVNPATPPKEVIDVIFQRHLVDLCKDLIHLVAVRTADSHDNTQNCFNFISASEILRCPAQT